MHIHGLTALKAKAVEMQFEGKTNEEIAFELFGDRMVGVEHKVHYYRQKVADMLKSDACVEYYRQIVLQMRAPKYVAKALSVLAKQLDSDNEWLANKAANDLLTKFYAGVMGENSNTLTISFEGMPELGAPETANLPEPGKDEQRVLDVVQAEESVVE